MHANSDARLDREIRFLWAQVRAVIRAQAGHDAIDLVDRVRRLALLRRRGDAAAESKLVALLSESDLPSLGHLIDAFSIFFDMANLAEDRQRIRVLRARERRGVAGAVGESLGPTLDAMREEGWSLMQRLELLRSMQLELVFTAHPTEAKRRSIREKVRDIRQRLQERDRPDLAPRRRRRVDDAISADLVGLWQTESVRFRRPTVAEELERSLFFAGTLWAAVPELHRTLASALADDSSARTVGPVSACCPALLRFGTWIGGDRDGNPAVTAAVTRDALGRLRREAIDRHIAQAAAARRALSMSTHRAGVTEALAGAVAEAIRRWPALEDHLAHLAADECCRRFLRIVQWRLERARAAVIGEPAPEGAYSCGQDLVDDLIILRGSLVANRGELIADEHVDDWIIQARVFGLHLLALDIRQESGWYHAVVGELLRVLGRCDHYADMDETARARILEPEAGGECGFPDVARLTPEARETVELFRLLVGVRAHGGADALGIHVISMTHAPGDLRAVRWLMRCAAFEHAGRAGAVAMPIAPLFETINDLARSPRIVEAILQDAACRSDITGPGGVLHVMIGYSDSTRDGGYLAACCGLVAAQRRLVEAAAAHGVPIRFFHGRGGALGRGGGPAARSIVSLPHGTIGGGLRVTEQGEVLAERYDDPEIAGRHLEQVVAAALRRTSLDRRPDRPARERKELDDVMTSLAGSALTAYRRLVGMPGFMSWFEQATPISGIEQLPIASRPARRGGARSLETLRAIPWVFSWTQARILLPAWYGIGTALSAFAEATADGPSRLARCYATDAAFRGIIENAALALAKADMGIARLHAGLVEDAALRDAVMDRIVAEASRSRDAILALSGRAGLLEHVPWLRRSIETRNPVVDPLNLVQVELFRRQRRTAPGSAARMAIDALIRRSIQAISGGLRTTG